MNYNMTLTVLNLHQKKDPKQGSHKIFILKFHDFSMIFPDFFHVFQKYLMAISNNIIDIHILCTFNSYITDQ